MVGEIQKLEKSPEVYGYIVLGTLELSVSHSYYQSAWFKADVHDEGLGVDYDVVVMEACHDYLVLGNINHIPGNIVISPEPILKELKEKLEEKNDSGDSVIMSSLFDMDTIASVDNYGKNMQFRNP